jgi:hypothetical protein
MAQLIALRRGEPIFDKIGLGTVRFMEYIEQLTGQVNTTTDETGEINVQLSQVIRVVGLVGDILKRQEKVVVTTVSLTAKPYEIVICNNTSAIEITTPINPIKGDILPAIKRKDAEIKVIGPIDGETFKIINVVNYSMKLAYDGNEWNEI